MPVHSETLTQVQQREVVIVVIHREPDFEALQFLFVHAEGRASGHRIAQREQQNGGVEGCHIASGMNALRLHQADDTPRSPLLWLRNLCNYDLMTESTKKARKHKAKLAGEGLIRTSIYLDPAVHEGLRILAVIRKVPMARAANDLLRDAVKKTKK